MKKRKKGKKRKKKNRKKKKEEEETHQMKFLLPLPPESLRNTLKMCAEFSPERW
jgi:hypothetical protein